MSRTNERGGGRVYLRGGHWYIDFRYDDEHGQKCRYRRPAKVNDREAAKEEMKILQVERMREAHHGKKKGVMPWDEAARS